MKRHPESDKVWSALRVPDCTQCELHKNAQSVCLLGDGPVPCDSMVIGEAPGYREDSIEIPFSGRSGVLLRRTLVEVGLDPRKLFITNTVACRPPENRTPKASEIKICSALYLDRQIEIVKPQHILILGGTALKWFQYKLPKGDSNKKKGVGALEGETISWNGITYTFSRHPSAVIRMKDDDSFPYHMQAFRENLIMFRKQVLGDKDEFTFRTEITAESFVDTKKPITLDIETNGLNPFREEAKIWTVALCQDPKEVTVVEWSQKVANQIKNLLNTCRFIFHRGTFEGTWFKYNLGVTPRLHFDTKLGAFLQDENEPSGLKYQAIKHLKVEPWAEGFDWQNPDIPKLKIYNGRDTQYEARLYCERDVPFLKNNSKVARLLKYILLPAEEVFIEVICNGFHIDEKQAKEKLKTCRDNMVKIGKKISRRAGKTVNPASPKQMNELFYDKLGLKCPVKSGKGNNSTAEAALIRIKHPAGEELMEWRKWKKYESTYILPWLDRGPVLHANYGFTSTDTGRLNSSMVSNKRHEKKLGATLHQCPRDKFIRNLITPRYKDWVILAADLSQAELRLVAHDSGDPTMIDIFNHDPHTEAGDIHLATVMDILKVAQEAIDEETRKKGKAVNFGFVYGMFAKKFQAYALEKFNVNFSRQESEDYREGYFDKYSMLRSWHSKVEAFVRSHGWIDSVFGRRRHLPQALWGSGHEEWVVREAVRQAINSPIQSAASDLDLFIAALIASYSLPWDFKIDCRWALPIGAAHDSLLFECHRDYALELKKGLMWTVAHLPTMKYFDFKFRVPIFMDVDIYSDCWKGDKLQLAAGA